MTPAIRTVFAIGFVAAVVFFGFEHFRRNAPPSGESVTGQATPPAAPPPSATPAPGAPPPESKTAPIAPGAPSPAAPPAPSKEAAAPAPGSAEAKGAFDIVRVEPSGEIVVAGRCAADCTAEITVNGRPRDSVKADAQGNWAAVPTPLPPGQHELGLTVTTPDGKQSTSEQTVTISVPQPPSKEVVVVLNEPDAPSKILQKPGQAPAAAPPPGEAVAEAEPGAGSGPRAPGGDLVARDPRGPNSKTPAQKAAALALGAIDAESGRFFVQGTAPAGAALRVYLNNALIAEPVTGANERWSVRVERGLSPGGYVTRVDHVEKPSGKVLARVEASFTYAPDVAAAPDDTASGAVSPSAAAGEAPEPGSATDRSRTAANDPAAQPGASRPGQTGRERPASAAGGRSDGRAAAGAAAASAGEPSAADASPAAIAAPEAPGRTAFDGSMADPANPVIATVDTKQVRRGDSLWRISRSIYGEGRRYTVIFKANDQIRNPNLIYPGQVFVLPAGASGEAVAR